MSPQPTQSTRSQASRSLWVASMRIPLARRRSDAHVWQRRRIGRQVGATTQFVGIESAPVSVRSPQQEEARRDTRGATNKRSGGLTGCTTARPCLDDWAWQHGNDAQRRWSTGFRGRDDVGEDGARTGHPYRDWFHTAGRTMNVVGAQTRARLCGLRVFVDEPAEAISPHHAVARALDHGWRGS